MAEDKRRSEFKRESDLLKTSDFYLQGITQSEIANVLGVSQGTVSNDLKELRKRWLDKSVQKIDALKAEELAKVDKLERTYWEAWVKSCDYQTVKKRNKDGQMVTVLVPLDQRNPMGDTKYLAGVQWCIDQRCKILGVNAPQKLAGPDGGDLKYIVKFE